MATQPDRPNQGRPFDGCPRSTAQAKHQGEHRLVAAGIQNFSRVGLRNCSAVDPRYATWRTKLFGDLHFSFCPEAARFLLALYLHLVASH
jgi:hypothetical protein